MNHSAFRRPVSRNLIVQEWFEKRLGLAAADSEKVEGTPKSKPIKGPLEIFEAAKAGVQRTRGQNCVFGGKKRCVWYLSCTCTARQKSINYSHTKNDI